MSLSVSIIIPVYNVENYIADCFQSIVNQTYTGPMECLFIDDCGNDGSVQILEGLIKTYDGPIEMRLLHHEKNKGLSVARNTGIANAKGDYLFFLDSDDQLYPFSISSLADAAIKENMPDVILGGYQVNIPNHPISHYCYNREVIDGQPAIAKAFLEDKLFCMAPNKLVRREFIVGNGLYFKEGIIHEDNLWSFQSFHLAHQVVTIPEKTYYYLIHSGSIMTSSGYEKSLENTKIIYDEIMHDISVGRYDMVNQKSINYLKDLINEKCIAVLLNNYSEIENRTNRVRKLKEIPDSIVQIIDKYWSPLSYTTRLLKLFFLSKHYCLFDILVVLSKKKNDLLQKMRID